MKLLVTGGAGYVGSHVCHLLAERGHRMVIVDDLSTGHEWAVPKGAELFKADVGDTASLEPLIAAGKFDALIHLAAKVKVEESVAQPELYYIENAAKTFHLFSLCQKHGLSKIIFSSTAAVYGEAVGACTEETLPHPVNPYGSSKWVAEMFLQDLANAHTEMRFVTLRYFNVAGAHSSGELGQATPGATHLIKVACEVAVGHRDHLMVYGTDYPTPDGTCVRDYIHVEDLAEAHALALNHLAKGGASKLFNCGYGRGHSVKDVVASMKKISGENFKVTQGPRRPGDPPKLLANSEKIKAQLGWRPRFDDLDTICRSAYVWEQVLSTRARPKNSV